MQGLDRIFLVDERRSLCDAWRRAFSGFDVVEVVEGDFFSRDADAMVSPANSFGIMDGGLDGQIRANLGGRVESELQRIILERHHGELHVGRAEVVATGHARWRYLVAAPTMRVPENVSQTVNAYVAFRAVLLTIREHNLANPSRQIASVLVPGLGTGVGGMDARRCAAQMRMALDQVSKPARIPSFNVIHQLHEKLRSS